MNSDFILRSTSVDDSLTLLTSARFFTSDLWIHSFSVLLVTNFSCRNIRGTFYGSSAISFYYLCVWINLQFVNSSADCLFLWIFGYILKIKFFCITICVTFQELESLVRLSELTHRLLAVHLPLDSFESMFNEANINVTSPYGRIAIATMFELTSQILPHYCFNGSTSRQVSCPSWLGSWN